MDAIGTGFDTFVKGDFIITSSVHLDGSQTRDSGAQDLLETNIRQRGDVGGSAKKVGLRIRELERLYGIQNGGDRKSDPKISELKNS